MLYKFKSRSTADLILLEPQARRLLHIMGKEPAASGIVTAAQIPAAVAALEAAVLAEERQAAEQQQAAAAARAQGGSESRDDSEDDNDDAAAQRNSEFVSLRQRAATLLDMLRRSAKEGHDVVWGA